jgi:hypothetical protein
MKSTGRAAESPAKEKEMRSLFYETSEKLYGLLGLF